MRLWSIHPSYLDAKDLVTLWREGLQARSVLVGKTRGDIHHPQLVRFLAWRYPLNALDAYLSVIFDEGWSRGYHFKAEKFRYRWCRKKVHVRCGQIKHEWKLLKKKLRSRDPGSACNSGED